MRAAGSNIENRWVWVTPTAERRSHEEVPPVARTIYDVTTHPEGWQVKKRDNTNASAVEATKDAAVSRGTERAKANQPSQLVVHKTDGTFGFEHKYGD